MSEWTDLDNNGLAIRAPTPFRPDLRDEPVIVLSNNDGCVIARSREASELGIRMGDPWFKVRKQDFPRKVHVFSSNYALYADMSNRVMTLLRAKAPRLEIYSIDEAFLDVRGIDFCTDYETFGRSVRDDIKAATGLTVGCTIIKPETGYAGLTAQINYDICVRLHAA